MMKDKDFEKMRRKERQMGRIHKKAFMKSTEKKATSQAPVLFLMNAIK